MLAFDGQFLSTVRRRTMCDFLYTSDRVERSDNACSYRDTCLPIHALHLDRVTDQIGRYRAFDVLTAGRESFVNVG